jgi:general secretion pathway protein I
MGKEIRDNGKSGTQVSELSFASGADPQPRTPALRPADARRRTLDSRRQAANAGFTLLEVMVALVVLALGIAAVLELFGGGLRLTTKSSRRTQAVVYAQNVMDRLLAQSTLEDGDDGGQFPGGFSWRAQVYEIRPDDDASPLQQKSQNQSEFFRLKQLNVEVYWSEGVGEQSYALRSLRTITDQPQPQAQQQ